MKWGIRLVLSGTAALVVGASTALATPAGLTVSPPFKDVEVNAHDGTHFPVTLFNSTTQDQVLSIKAVDFRSLDETGGVAFTGDNDNLTKKYGLAKWLSTSSQSVTVPHGGSASVNVAISNGQDLSPGGHYGAILFQLESGQSGPAQNPVAFREVVASLILLKKLGGEHYDLNVAGTTGPSVWWWKLPATINVRFKNDGNVHVVPRGIITLKDPWGRVVCKGTINPESGAVLPESIRSYPVTMQSQGTAWLPGIYRVSVAYRFEGSDQVKQYTRLVTVVNGFVLATLALIFVIIGGLIGVWHRRRQAILPWPVAPMAHTAKRSD